MRGTAVGLLYNLSLQAECAQPGLELRCSRPIQALGRLVSGSLAMAAPSVAGTGLVGFAVAMATQYSGSRYRSEEESGGAGAQAGEKKKTQHHNGGRQFGAFHFEGSKGIRRSGTGAEKLKAEQGAVWGKQRGRGREPGEGSPGQRRERARLQYKRERFRKQTKNVGMELIKSSRRKSKAEMQQDA